MRRTKIVCTMGPNTDKKTVMKALVKNGMDVARFNFSHGDHEDHKNRMNLLKNVREELDKPVAILLDTKGPEIRTGLLEGGKKVMLQSGGTFTLYMDERTGNEEGCSITYPGLVKEVKKGNRILIDDGLIELLVDTVKKDEIVCQIVNGGELGQRKGVNVPNVQVKLPAITEKDREDILFGISQDIDFIAASFVRNATAVNEIRKILTENHAEHIAIIAKIENAEGVDNIDEICEIADGVMVARGDLGVEIPFIEVPAIQKYLIKKCRLLGKRVITATEMLESMIHNPRPTRAEISDVANAVYDGSSAIMLSGESAAGKYPVEAVRNMAEIAEYTEKNIDYVKRFYRTDYVIKNNLDALSHATCAMAIDTKAKGIVISSISGMTVRMVSRFRCPVDIVGMTTSQKAWRKLNLSWGVTPVMSDEFESVDVMFYHASRHAMDILELKSGDNIILTGGQASKQSGSTNTIRLETIR